MNELLSVPGVAKATRPTRSKVRPTGAFGAQRAPKYKGDPVVQGANDDLARRASREMRRWKRSLPKGVRV